MTHFTHTQPFCLCLHTRNRVVHVKAVAFDVFQRQTSVDKDPVIKHNNNTAEACKTHDQDKMFEHKTSEMLCID